MDILAVISGLYKKLTGAKFALSGRSYLTTSFFVSTERQLTSQRVSLKFRLIILPSTLRQVQHAFS